MPLFDATMNSADKTDEWMRKLVGKKLGDENEASSETVRHFPLPPCPHNVPISFPSIPFFFPCSRSRWGWGRKLGDEGLTEADLLQARPPAGAPRYQAGDDGHQGLSA